jgi:ubiquinone/menaquinone biosynthesis C-methylase UbiE
VDSKADRYIPALRYRWLTRFYDPVVALTTREKIFKRKLLALVASTHPAKVLDLACGTGTLARMIRLDCPDSTVHGLDGDPEILELARGKSRREGMDIHFDHGISYAMPYPDHTFDVLVSSLFFHHLSTINKQRTMAEIQRVLKPNGRLFVCDWGKPASSILKLSVYLVQILDGFDVTRDNLLGRLPRLIASAGFKQVEVVERISTVLGTLDLITAFNAEAESQNRKCRL